MENLGILWICLSGRLEDLPICHYKPDVNDYFNIRGIKCHCQNKFGKHADTLHTLCDGEYSFKFMATT